MPSHALFPTIDAPLTLSPLWQWMPVLFICTKTVTLKLELRQLLQWIFNIADVQKPFLRHFGLLVDVKQYQLIDTTTHLYIQGILFAEPLSTLSICPKDISHPYHTLLSEFPALMQSFTPGSPVKHDIVHHIETTGAPVSVYLRPLAPNHLHAAKQ